MEGESWVRAGGGERGGARPAQCMCGILRQVAAGRWVAGLEGLQRGQACGTRASVCGHVCGVKDRVRVVQHGAWSIVEGLPASGRAAGASTHDNPMDLKVMAI